MELFRISTSEFSENLTSSGRANRWNYDNEFVMYSSRSRSLSTLEIVVHRNSIKPDNPYDVMVLHVPDDDFLIKQMLIKDLPSNWRKLIAYSELQKIGSRWYHEQKFLILKVPSVIIQQEYNYIINTKHPDFESIVKLIDIEPYFWDTRLL